MFPVAAAASVLISAGSLLEQTVQTLQSTGPMSYNRSCLITIANHFPRPEDGQNTEELQQRSLHYVDHYCGSGDIRIYLSPTVLPGTKDACGFSKTADSARGSCGVLKLAMDTAQGRVFIYLCFAVTFTGRNYFGLSVEPKDESPEAVFKEFFERKTDYRSSSYAAKHANIGGPLSVRGWGIKVDATMGDGDKEEMKVEIWPE